MNIHGFPLSTDIMPLPDNPLPPDIKKFLLIIGILVGFIPTFDISAVNVALPSIMNEYHLDAITLSWISTSYLLASAVLLVPIGRFADIHGRKRVFFAGTALFSLASLAMALIPSSGLFILVRVIQGFGAAMIFVTALAIFVSVFPPQERARALGLTTTAAYLGLVLGPLLGGILTEHFGWRSIFLVNVPLGALACLLILWHLPGEWADCAREPFDLKGSIIYACSLLAITVGFTLLPDRAGALLLCTGGVLGVLFFLYERHVPEPVLDVRLLFENRVFLYSNIAAFTVYAGTFAVTFFLSLDLQFTRGLSPIGAGAVLIVQPVFMTLFSPIAGRLSEWTDARVVATAGVAVTTASLVMLTFLGGSSPLWYILACLVMLGVGFGLFSSPNINVIMSSVEAKYLGVASGMNGTTRLVGQTFSMGIAMMLFAIFIGPVVISPSNYPQFATSMHSAFVIFSVLCLAGIVASLIRGTQHSVGEQAAPGR